MTLREQVVVEARTWLGTPYHSGAHIKGAGADCFTWIAETLISCGVMEKLQLPFYSRDWFCHTDQEHYMALLMRFASRLPLVITRPGNKIEPGNIVLTIAGDSKIHNHGALVTKWPRAIHAIDPCVEEIDLTSHHMWAYRPVSVHDPFVGAGAP